MPPLLSVIVPVYNTKKYLRECIDSILAQTYHNYELILVDDGSNDGSSEICDEYAMKYEQVTVIHKENCGLLHTRKVGFERAKGEYISYIDSDDYIKPEMYEYMLEKALIHNADVVMCNLFVKTREGMYTYPKAKYNGLYTKARLEKELYTNMVYSGKEKNVGIAPSLCNKIIRKSLLEKTIKSADNRISYGEDALCSFPCLLDAERVYCCEEKYFYCYRQVENSLTVVYDENLLEKFHILIRLLGEAFEARNFEWKKQLYCYGVRTTFECIRRMMLSKESNLEEVIEKIRKYLNYDIIKKAFEEAPWEDFDRLTKVKLHLVRKGRFKLLYVLFLVKGKYIKIKGEVEKCGK